MNLTANKMGEGLDRPFESSEEPASPAARRLERANECRSIAGLYWFLGRCLEDEVDAEFLALLKGPLRPALAEIGLYLGDCFLDTNTEDDVVALLAEEFTALFVAPGAASPYRSVFEKGCTFQEPCDEAIASYREAGLEFRNRHSGEFPDHIGVMLGFVGWLAEHEADSLEADDESAANTWRIRRESFLLRQIGPWGAGWCRRARILTNHPFYQYALELTERVLLHDLYTLADRRKFKELEWLNQRAPVHLDYDADFRKASGL